MATPKISLFFFRFILGVEEESLRKIADGYAKFITTEGKPKFIPFNDELMDTADVEEDLLYMLLGTTHGGPYCYGLGDVVKLKGLLHEEPSAVHQHTQSHGEGIELQLSVKAGLIP
nr:hypothetical protein Iba_chr07eCG5330 [Ipomoea batatas]